MPSYLAYIGSILTGDRGPRPRVDPTYGDENLRAVRRELRAGRWESAEEILAQPMDWDSRHFYVEGIVRWPGKPSWIEAWVAATPASAHARLVRAAHNIRWAWEARGDAWVPNMSKLGEFQSRLATAGEQLEDVARRSPQDPTPWAFQIEVCRGLQRGLEESLRMFKECVRRHSDHVEAHHAMLQNACWKWSRNEAAMWKFVNQATARAPQGSPVHSLVPLAMLEQVRVSGMHGPKIDIVEYMGRNETMGRLLAAASAYPQSPQRRAVLGEPRYRNMFAATLFAIKQRAAACEEFRACGPYVEPMVWGRDTDEQCAESFMGTRRLAFRLAKHND